MEMNNNRTLINNRYVVIKKMGSGGSADVYKVEDIRTNTIYAAKVFKIYSDYLDKEINILKLVNNPSIINFIDEGNGPILENGQLSSDKKYIILEYAEKGSLFNYISRTKRGLKEKYAKVIFKKILNCVLECHKRGICYRNIKLENILLDEKFNPKIYDFGFAKITNKEEGILRVPLRTQSHIAPEILLKREYDGIKTEIFSLGFLLFILVTGKPSFETTKKRDPLYGLIIAKQYNKYWKKISGEIPETSQEFKDLFIKMVNFNPKNRISIEEILDKDGWLNEIRKLNNEELEKLENEINNELLEREDEASFII